MKNNNSQIVERIVSTNKIKINIDFINGLLPTQPTTVKGIYRLPYLLENKAIKSDCSQESIQDIANHINFYLGIVIPVKVIMSMDYSNYFEDLHFQFNSAEKVGLYKVFGDSEREIHITKKAKFDLNQILAILIHESIHNYLDYYKIKKEVEYDNEILTDLTAVYLGFGKYLLNGYKTIEYPILNGTRYTQIGYIKYKDIIKAMNYSALKRNIVEIAHSLTLGQKLKIKKEINKRKNHLLIKEKINMILKKINILYNSYNECTIMFKRLSSEKIQKSFSDQESKILYTFAQMLSTQKIIVKLNLLKKELDNEENHRIKNINQIELKVNSIEDRISKWYYLLKDY